jgi:moderate conductance mechanosensitive channel
VIIVVTSLMVLSHLGIDIAPLLAGAGVVGLAIGFGSQALVKDIITGLFILLEDQIAVGDIVDVGKDHKGVVEAITIRTIRMRDVSGTVHTVPFSEVTSVKNLSKDFSYAVARITISYREDIDRVVEILRGVGDQLAQDEAVQPFIMNPFEYMGSTSSTSLRSCWWCASAPCRESNWWWAAPSTAWSKSHLTSTALPRVTPLRSSC